jgi:hypothetical protein
MQGGFSSPKRSFDLTTMPPNLFVALRESSGDTVKKQSSL